MELLALFQKRCYRLQIDDARRVGFCILGTGMAFKKKSLDASRNRGMGEERSVLGIAAAGGSKAAGLLGGMGHIEDHRDAERLHDRQAGEIVDEAVVAEECAALGEHDVGI